MNQLVQTFQHEQFGAVRTVIINNEVWFVGKDVATALGYSNTRDALIRHVSADDKVVGNHDSLGGNQKTTFINESGLYSLVLSSKLPQAKKFKKWVTNEVLPTIRQTGAYMTPKKIEEVLYNPDLLIGLANQIKDLNNKVEILEPKAIYYDRILDSKSLITTTQIAKDYGMSAQTFNQKLASLKIQYKQNDQWLLYAKHQSKGYVHSQTMQVTHSDGTNETKMATKWTQKGRLFLYEMLKKQDVVPVIEQNLLPVV